MLPVEQTLKSNLCYTILCYTKATECVSRVCEKLQLQISGFYTFASQYLSCVLIGSLMGDPPNSVLKVVTGVY